MYKVFLCPLCLTVIAYDRFEKIDIYILEKLALPTCMFPCVYSSFTEF